MLNIHLQVWSHLAYLLSASVPLFKLSSCRQKTNRTENNVCSQNYYFDFTDETDVVKTVKKKLPKTEDKAACSGVVYSTDIWCLIGAHVHPADIHRFAAICRGTHYVSHTARFWIDIYKRLAYFGA